MRSIQEGERDKMRSLNYILISGFFGFISIIADQYSYQLEKTISLLEYEQDNKITLNQYGKSINEISVDLQNSLAKQHDIFISSDLSDRELTEDFNNLKLAINNQLESISDDELFVLIAPDSLNATMQKNLGFITEEQNFEKDFLEFYDNFWDDLSFMILSGSELSADALTEILELFDRISDLRFYRQISLITAICASFLSLFFIFIFFKRIIKKT